MRWYVASLADGDTHLAEPMSAEQLVVAQRDGRRFRPLVALPATPLDDAQVCPTCQAHRMQARSTRTLKTSNTESRCANAVTPLEWYGR